MDIRAQSFDMLTHLSNTTAPGIKAADGKPANAASSESEAAKVARSFEALLLHNMLKSMRRAAHTDQPSNARAMYDDMLDQRLAEIISDSDRLGIAESIARKLEKRAENHQAALAGTAAATALQRNAAQRSGNSDSLAWASQLFSDTQPVSQSVSVQENFIKQIQHDANAAAQRIGTPAEAVIAVAALETGWGKHVLADQKGQSSNNLFGIKTHSERTAGTTAKTTEFFNGRPHVVDDEFRTYRSTTDSVNDFAEFLLSNPRYKKALDRAADPESFLLELQRAGYATDPDYASKAVRVLRQIEAYRAGSAL